MILESFFQFSEKKRINVNVDWMLDRFWSIWLRDGSSFSKKEKEEKIDKSYNEVMTKSRKFMELVD